jgi:hypothetical protein
MVAPGAAVVEIAATGKMRSGRAMTGVLRLAGPERVRRSRKSTS